MSTLMLHRNEIDLVKRLGLASKDLRQDKDSYGDYYLVASIAANDLNITLFSESYAEPIVIEGQSI